MQLPDLEAALELFPFFPYLRAIAHSSLLAVTNDGSAHQRRILKNLILLGTLVIHVFHQSYSLRLAVPVNQVIDPPNCPKNRIKFFTGQSETEQVYILILDAPFFKIPLRLLTVEALPFSKDLNIQYVTSKRHSPQDGTVKPASSRLAPNNSGI